MYDKLLEEYKIRKECIKERLEEFKSIYNKPVSWFFENDSMILKPSGKPDNERIFEELVFCILTANTSAVMGMKAVDSARNILTTGTFQEVQNKLKNAGYRFPNARAEYIVETRKRFTENYGFDFKNIIENSNNRIELREFFVKNVKGFAYKEASHFLRNIGVFGLAILDKHILNSLLELSVIHEVPKSLDKKRYLDIEQKLAEFSKKINIGMDEMDLLLWSIKNGSGLLYRKSAK